MSGFTKPQNIAGKETYNNILPLCAQKVRDREENERRDDRISTRKGITTLGSSSGL